MISVFEGYEVDSARLEVRRNGDVLPVEPQVFEVLAYLVAHRDRVVSKEELLDNVWGNRFVSESALTSRIKTARRLIGDDGSRQRLIRTIHGRGYRFVATVEDPGTESTSATALADPDRPLPERPVPVTVGRDAELDQLRSHVAAARDGQRRVVFIAGGAGIGKTTLADRLLAELDGEEHVVGVGQCVEHRGSGEAYLPVLQAVTEMCTAAARSKVLDHLVRRAPTWLPQMPGLAPADHVAAPPTPVVAGSRDRMLREMLDALHAAAQQTARRRRARGPPLE